MYPKIACPHCGYMLGDSYVIYTRILLAHIAASGRTPDKWNALPTNFCMGDVLNALHVTKICCRSTILTQVNLSNLLP